jgi:putative transposase
VAKNGRPFQGRYKAWHVEPGAVLAQVANYIHLNPLAAGIVAADELLSFRHGSLYWFAERKRPAWLNPSTVLHESGELTDTAEGWRCYCQYLATLAEEDPPQVIGSAAFALECSAPDGGQAEGIAFVTLEIGYE